MTVSSIISRMSPWRTPSRRAGEFQRGSLRIITLSRFCITEPMPAYSPDEMEVSWSSSSSL